MGGYFFVIYAQGGHKFICVREDSKGGVYNFQQKIITSPVRNKNEWLTSS